MRSRLLVGITAATTALVGFAAWSGTVSARRCRRVLGPAVVATLFAGASATTSSSCTPPPTTTTTTITTTTTTTTVPATTTTTVPPSAFVTRSGQTLSANGQPYHFVGFNLWRANVTSWNQPPNTGYDVNDGTTLSDSLSAISAGGPHLNVIRAWFFQQFTIHNDGTNNQDWSAFDKTLAVARAHGYRVIATLADEWAWEWNNSDQPALAQSWYGGGYQNAVQPKELVPYLTYVAAVTARYANDPTILAWEMVNEPNVEGGTSSCATESADETSLASFVTTVGDTIRANDPNHLISLGSAGAGGCGAIDTDYQTIHALPELDLCSFHDYYGAANAGATNSGNGLNVHGPQCAADNKPIFIGEVGIHLNTSPVNGSLTTRATYLGQKMSTQFGTYPGMVGYVPWHFDLRGYSDDYNYSAGDPAMATMDPYAAGN